MKQKETPSTKLCKHCQFEIPYNAKVCPNCRKKVKGGFVKWVVIVLALVLLLAMCSSGEDASDTPAKVGEVSSTADLVSTAATEPQKEAYSVGDILADGDMQIVYIASGDFISDNEYSQPAEGNKYIFLRFAFINTSTSDDHSVSFYDFECYADGYAAEMYYGSDEELSATLSAGRSTEGYIYFEVPADAEEIEIEYTTNALSGAKIKFLFEGNLDSGYILETNTARTEGAFAVGDTVESSKLKITYLSCEDYISDNMFVTPKDGYKFITCMFEFENLGDSDEFISSWGFDCYADGVSCDGCYIRDDDLSATLSAGRKANGTVTFEVPVDAEVIEVEYLSNYWTSNRVVFTVQ